MCGKLYVVATPIGNLGDITLRAIEILKMVDFIIAEDTRHTLKLLNHLGITKQLISYYKQNENMRAEKIIDRIEAGENVALVSDAGTPGISDPGEVIIKQAIMHNIIVVPIPGACASINALICSGLNCSHFYFEGFLPVNRKERIERLEQIKYINSSVIFYEAPHKLKKTLEDIRESLGNRNIVLAKEITKIHEQYIRGNIEKVLSELPEEIKGEYVIVMAGNEKTKKDEEKEIINKLTLEEHYDFYEAQGFEKKEIIKKIAKDRNVSKNEIYQMLIGKK